jgi:hypothetical protein
MPTPSPPVREQQVKTVRGRSSRLVLVNDQVSKSPMNSSATVRARCFTHIAKQSWDRHASRGNITGRQGDNREHDWHCCECKRIDGRCRKQQSGDETDQQHRACNS